MGVEVWRSVGELGVAKVQVFETFEVGEGGWYHAKEGIFFD